MLTIKLKKNGYNAESLQPIIESFEKATKKLFPECVVKHFYYNDFFDMVDVILGKDNYAHFNITEKRVCLTGYTCNKEILLKFESMTYNDILYDGQLLKIANE